MSLIKLTAASVLLALVRADHVVTFKNSCPFALQPMWKGNHNGDFDKGALIPAGGASSATLPEIWESGRIYAQDPKKSCAEPDGGNCTLLECSFGKGSPRWWQCNISLVSGYNVPASLKFVGGKEDSCKTSYSCLSRTCPSTQAYRQESEGGCKQCINQCNTDNVGLAIEFCQKGSTVPNFGQSAPSKPDPKPDPKPADPKPKPQPDRPIPTPGKDDDSDKPGTSPNPGSSSSLVPTPVVNVAPKPTKHCSRARRRARRAHKRALAALQHSH